MTTDVHPLTHLNDQEPPMGQPQPTPPQQPVTHGATVRVVIDCIVQAVQPGRLVTTDGLNISTDAPNVRVDVMEQGYRTGDNVLDGTSQLFRIQPPDGAGYWIGTDGVQYRDEEIILPRLRLLARPEPQA